MTPEWLTAIATAGTFIVIAASAVAAIFQLRHMRGSNQITALTECRERLESREFQDARQFIRSEEFHSLLKDNAVRQSLRAATLPVSLYRASHIANFFESLGSFVRNGIIDKSIACDLWGHVVYSCWQELVPMIRIFREPLPAVWENFEYLAVLSKLYAEAHPSSFPRHLPRLPLADELE